MLKFKNKRLLIISPHPDDEVIGCGGLIAKVKKEGGKVFVLFLTNGDTKDFSKSGKSTRTQRAKEIERVAKFMNYDDYHIVMEGNPYHLKLDSVPQLELIEAIERSSRLSIEKVKPAAVLFPHPESYSQDHRASAFAAFAACRPADGRLKFQPKMVLAYEIPADQWGLGKFPIANFYVKLSSGNLKKKLAAVELYKSQEREHPNPRSILTLKSLATLRGAHSNFNLAEAFFCYRLVSL
jgi:LmbE family N-acetylglucosaminyl deacetylase